MHIDYLIVGSGIAGLNFALNAAEHGNVLIVTKKETIDSATNYAQGGIAAVIEQTDSFEKHIHDTLVAGCFHNKEAAVELIVKKGPEAVKKLIQLGVNFNTQAGSLLLAKEGAHSHRRVVFAGDHTGNEIEQTLIKKVKQHKNIRIYEHTFAVDLIIQNKKCLGLSVIHQGWIKNVLSGATILATGGLGQIFSRTTNPEISTGDGIAMAHRANLELKDLEFIQFHPTVFYPKNDRPFLISEAVRGEGGILINKKGERFMVRYHQQAELAPRDIVSRAIYQEEKKGPVFLSIVHKTSKQLKLRFPTIYQTLKKNGYDMSKTPIPVSPAAHYCCGGIAVDLHGKTQLENLYAFGETAYTGAHGANRLASNSLLEAVVFSNQILAEIKQKKTEGTDTPPIVDIEKAQNPSPKEKALIQHIRKRIQHTMWNHVGIIRTHQGLKKAISELEHIQNNLFTKISHKKNVLYLETVNMLQTAHLVNTSALSRPKSLGCHWME